MVKIQVTFYASEGQQSKSSIVLLQFKSVAVQEQHRRQRHWHFSHVHFCRRHGIDGDDDDGDGDGDGDGGAGHNPLAQKMCGASYWNDNSVYDDADEGFAPLQCEATVKWFHLSLCDPNQKQSLTWSWWWSSSSSDECDYDDHLMMLMTMIVAWYCTWGAGGHSGPKSPLKEKYLILM